jgi:hypothetical protein
LGNPLPFSTAIVLILPAWPENFGLLFVAGASFFLRENLGLLIFTGRPTALSEKLPVTV